MKQALSDAAFDVGQNWLALLLAGLGISAMQAHEFIGGLFLALAAGSVVARARKDKRKLFFILSMAALGAILMAELWPFLAWNVPPQLGMTLAGAASSWGVSLFVKIGDRVQSKGGVIADKIINKVLPDGEDK